MSSEDIYENRKRTGDGRTFGGSKGKKAALAVVIAAAVAAAVLLIIFNWRFLSFSEKYVDKNEDTMSYAYYSVEDHMLKCGLDTATYFDKFDNQIWSINYDMNEPKMVKRGSTMAVYDRLGTTICICRPEGEIGRFQTSLPILHLEVASNGMTAALLDDGNVARICVYNSDGSMVATIKTTMEANGYPMDIAISSSGVLLGVSYLQFGQGMPVTTVNFYNFGAKGRAATDNIISSYSYENQLIPMIHFLDNSTCIAFASDGVTLYKGKDTPKEFRKVKIDGTIASAFYDDKHFGVLIRDDENPKEYILQMYNSLGMRTCSEETDFAYSSVQLERGEVIMYNSTEMCVYSASGTLRFKKELTPIVRQVISFGNLYYGYVNDESYVLIRLR